MRRRLPPPAPLRARILAFFRKPALVTGGLVGLGGVIVAVVLDVAVGRSALFGSHPALGLGTMVTMVGPLGVTFPCWAATHFARGKVPESGPEPGRHP